jgi:hypothetical protein
MRVTRLHAELARVARAAMPGFEDMQSEQRWPDYAQHAAAHGVRSSLSVPLMERYQVDVDEAFTLLTHASQHTNIKLRDVADELVRTGTLAGRFR